MEALDLRSGLTNAVEMAKATAVMRTTLFCGCGEVFFLSCSPTFHRRGEEESGRMNYNIVFREPCADGGVLCVS